MKSNKIQLNYQNMLFDDPVGTKEHNRIEKLEKIKNESKTLDDRVLGYVEYGFKELDINFHFWMKHFFDFLVEKRFFENKNPLTMATGFIYAICRRQQYNVIWSDIRNIFGISEQGMRKGYVKIYEFLENRPIIYGCDYCNEFRWGMGDLYDHKREEHPEKPIY